MTEAGARLRGVVADRMDRRIEGDHPDTREVLKAALAELSPAQTDQQPVYWQGHEWAAKPYWHDRTGARLSALARALDPGGDRRELVITRRDVFDHRANPVDLFLTAMAWGHGTTGYGCWRTAAMVNPGGQNQEGRIAAAVDAYRAAWNDGGAEAVARAWTRGPGKIAGLGPAFASKVTYFALYNREAKTGPLIADLNTAWSVWALAGIWDSRYDPVKYADYVAWCERWGAKLRCRSDDVERALFSLGPEIRRLEKVLGAPSGVSRVGS